VPKAGSRDACSTASDGGTADDRTESTRLRWGLALSGRTMAALWSVSLPGTALSVEAGQAGLRLPKP
jgi:hypothetical protein